MITPHQMDLWTSNFSELYNALEGEIIRSMIKRLSNGQTDILEWQAEALKDLRLFNRDVAKHLSDVTGIAQDEIVEIMEQAGNEMISEVDKSMPYEKLEVPSNIDEIMRSYSNQAWSDIDNLVNQTLISTNYGIGTATQAYQQVLNRVQALYNSGLLTLDEAMERAIKELSHQGIKSTFIDKGGHTWSMERYVRTVLRSTLANTYNQLRTDRMAEYGVHTVVVTSHMGARRQCSRIQGQVVDLRRTSQLPKKWEYRSIYDPYWGAAYGTAGGHRGINCQHLHIPFIPGVSTNNQPQYDPKENDKVAKLLARQNQLERRIIRLKKDNMISNELGNVKESEALRKKIRAAQSNMRDLVASNDYLHRDYGREKVYTPLDSLMKEHEKNVIIEHRKPNVEGFSRHIKGTKDYEKYLKEKTRTGQVPGILTAQIEEIRNFVSQNVSDNFFEKPGKYPFNFGKEIGIFVDQTTGEMLPTTWGIIHVGKNGYHIVPANPKRE